MLGMLAEVPLFIEELQTQYNLQATQNISKFFTDYNLEHENRFNVKFLDTLAMHNDVWNNHFLKRTDMLLPNLQSMAIKIKYVKIAMKNINVL